MSAATSVFGATSPLASQLAAKDLTIVATTDAATASVNEPLVATVNGTTVSRQDAIRIPATVTMDGRELTPGVYYWPSDSAAADVNDLVSLLQFDTSVIEDATILGAGATTNVAGTEVINHGITVAEMLATYDEIEVTMHESALWNYEVSSRRRTADLFPGALFALSGHSWHGTINYTFRFQLGAANARTSSILTTNATHTHRNAKLRGIKKLVATPATVVVPAGAVNVTANGGANTVDGLATLPIPVGFWTEIVLEPTPGQVLDGTPTVNDPGLNQISVVSHHEYLVRVYSPIGAQPPDITYTSTPVIANAFYDQGVTATGNWVLNKITGVLEQWGSLDPIGTTGTVTFPTPFHANIAGQNHPHVSVNVREGNYIVSQAYEIGAAHFRYFLYTTSNGGVHPFITWHAIGYSP